MNRNHVAVGLAVACMALSSAVNATEQDPGEAGVRAAENAWSRAFITGDARFLDGLLDPAYVSVGTNGSPRPKADIIAAAKRFAEQHPGAPVQPLPPTSTISIKGSSAVVTHHGEKETSVDVFYYSDGSWHAWYSQHTTRASTS
ncbi:nuclear transport factor 2 family protein [Dyella solisilvae]|uniref:Nuclear transport factor 2 family protein n=1 Tax=Dyella solisilvae TaxID=1920168 RepID=A0A370K5U8_9GAMM|nr:nuclear transport factor 2 family protein [Dyella solisilvae]RDI98025.1 nuclear transport factor 2 family protein [Dyella solisilvae]